MRVAVLSDVHSNLAALEAVLAEVEVAKVDEIWSLGDVTGYNARPAQCLSLLRQRASVMLAGNHDLVVCERIPSIAFRDIAADAAAWSRKVLTAEELDYLASLHPDGERHGVELYHASIRDPVWEYVTTADVALACLQLQVAELALIGHSHVALELWLEDDELVGGQAEAGSVVELGGRPVLLNPGSVGQPRDADPRAAWLLLDLAAGSATFHRTEYEIARTQREIREAGLPERLAERLAHGL